MRFKSIIECKISQTFNATLRRKIYINRAISLKTRLLAALYPSPLYIFLIDTIKVAPETTDHCPIKCNFLWGGGASMDLISQDITINCVNLCTIKPFRQNFSLSFRNSF